MLDREQLIKHIEIAFPLTKRPYEALAHTLNTTEDEVIHSLEALKRNNSIRSIAGIFDAKSLGYTSGLVAFKVPREHIERAVSVINPLPGVSHNYLRNGDYNVWFTLALHGSTDFTAFVASLARESNADTFNIFHSVRMVKLSARFSADNDIRVHDTHASLKRSARTIAVDDRVKNAVKVLQYDLPLVSEPFSRIAALKHIPADPDEVLSIGGQLLQAGVMRSYRAVVRHHTFGFIANAMTVWKPNSQQMDSVLQQFSNEKAISHLYVREAYDQTWEYPVFAMIHAKSEEELSGIIGRLHASAQCDYRCYRSLQEFKKERVRYFE